MEPCVRCGRHHSRERVGVNSVWRCHQGVIKAGGRFDLLLLLHRFEALPKVVALVSPVDALDRDDGPLVFLRVVACAY